VRQSSKNFLSAGIVTALLRSLVKWLCWREGVVLCFHSGLGLGGFETVELWSLWYVGDVISVHDGFGTLGRYIYSVTLGFALLAKTDNYMSSAAKGV